MHARKIAHDGFRLLSQAVLMVLRDHPHGLKQIDIARSLCIKSGSRNNLEYKLFKAIIALLINERSLKKVGTRYLLKGPNISSIPFQFPYDPVLSVQEQVRRLFRCARECGHEEIVAATLAEAAVLLNNSSNRTSLDTQYDDSADTNGRSFRANGTVFRIYMKPVYSALEKCLDDLRAGNSLYVLVPERFILVARENAEIVAEGRITVATFEDFISQIVANLAGHTRISILQQLRRLLSVYNDRVGEFERAESLHIEMPPGALAPPATVTNEMVTPSV